MASTPPPSPRQRAADAVHRYLHSARGHQTPTRVRARLLLLDWEAIGGDPSPTDDQVHWTRMWLEESSLEEARRMLAQLRAARGFEPANDAPAEPWRPAWASR